MKVITRALLVASALAFVGLSLAPGADAEAYIKKIEPTSPGDYDAPAGLDPTGDDDNVVTPEPGTLALLGMGLAGAVAARRRKRRSE